MHMYAVKLEGKWSLRNVLSRARQGVIALVNRSGRHLPPGDISELLLCRLAAAELSLSFQD